MADLLTQAGEISVERPVVAPGTATPAANAAAASVVPTFGLTAAGEPERIIVLDGLRGVAILMVLVLHFTLMGPGPGLETAILRTAELGWVGVDLFFVLSGFLITGILWDSRGQDGYFVRFYARRTVRIFPLYYAFLIGVMVILPALVDSYAAEYAARDNRIWLWTYLSNVLMAREGWEGVPSHTTHLWSLAIEEQFYLLWPLVVWRANWRGLVGVCVAVIVASPLIRLGLNASGALPAAAYTMLPARMDGLAAGALLALVVRRDYTALQLNRWGRWLLLGAVTGLTAMVLYGRTEGWGGLLPALEQSVQVGGYSLIAMACGGFLLYAITAPSGSVVRAVLGTRSLRLMGQYSYGLYVLHVPIRNLMRDRLVVAGGLPRLWGSQLPAQVLLMVVAIAASWGIALISWHLYEKHWLRLKRRFPYQRNPQ